MSSGLLALGTATIDETHGVGESIVSIISEFSRIDNFFSTGPRI